MHTFARFVVATLSAASPIALQAQIAPPTSGLLVSYQYWPVQYVQWVGAELPYSMIELDVDAGAKQPLYNVVLTDRAGKRITYANTDGLVASATAQGMEAHKANIAFEAADAQAVGAASTLRLTMADGKPMQWRFVQGSDVSEQGAGLTPLPNVPIPVLLYREQAAVAGEGTALQIGDTTSAAEVWTEISKPPYFVAYRGAVSLSSHMTVLSAGKETWTIASAPSDWKVGGTWELDGEHGNHRTLRVDNITGTNFVISGSDRFQPSIAFTLEGTRSDAGYSIDRITYAPVREGSKHFMAIQFAQPLTTASTSATVDMMIGKKAKMASATLALAGAAADRTATVQMQTPAWAKGKSLTEETTTSPTGITILAKPVK